MERASKDGTLGMSTAVKFKFTFTLGLGGAILESWDIQTQNKP
jgi:hypothetical protein